LRAATVWRVGRLRGGRRRRAYGRPERADRAPGPDAGARAGWQIALVSLTLTIDGPDPTLGHRVLLELTERFPAEPHFWNHLGRHQIYRMKRDFDRAEEYLTEATRLSPDDFIHHHTLGLVRRYRVRQTLNAAKGSQPAELIRVITPLFDGAVRAFEKTRDINQDNVYGYITHVQMILEVAAKLKQAAAVRTIAQIPDDAQEWVQDQVAIASTLIDTASELYATIEKTDTYLTTCVADLQRLYDNLDDVIQVWELAHERSGGNAASRRALAHAYVTRAGQRWSALGEAELRRIVHLMEINLRHSSRREDDYRLWCETYKLLPEFDIDEALSRLRVWAERFPSWRAYCYIYAMHFILWFSGRTDRTDELDNALEECQARAFGRKNISHNWFGFAPQACALVAAADLGDWDRKKNFWKTAQGLRRVNGVIDVIHGSQAGAIVIDGRVRAFFVPMKEFSANKDENEAVNFYLGFSASGLRAWSVARGWIAEGARDAPRADDVPLFTAADVPVPDKLKEDRARELGLARIQAFCRDLVTAKSALGAPISLDQLRSQVDACFGIDDVSRILGFDNIRGLIGEVDTFAFILDGSQTIVRDATAALDAGAVPPAAGQRTRGHVFRNRSRENWGLILDENDSVRYFSQGFVRQGHWKRLQEGGAVDFKADTTERGPVAVDVQALKDGNIRDLVRTKGVEFVRRLVDAGQVIRKRDLLKYLRELFGGWIPAVTADSLTGGLESLFKEADGISFTGEGPERIVTVNDFRAAGRIQSAKLAPSRAGASPSPDVVGIPKPSGPVTKLPDVRLDPMAVAKWVVEIVGAAPSKQIGVQTLGQRLKEHFPVQGPLARHLGVRRFPDFLAGIDGIEVSGEDPNLMLRLKERSRKEGPTPGSVKGQGKHVSTAEHAPALIRKLLSAAPSRRLSISRLGLGLKSHYPGKKTLAQQLGARSFPEFLARVEGIEIAGTPPSLQIGLRADRVPEK